jgi:hypothetical protein
MNITKYIALATDYTTPFCCDRHNNGFNIEEYLPSKLYQGPSAVEAKEPSQAAKLRAKAERERLEDKVIDWVYAQAASDLDNRPTYEILSPEKTKILLRMEPKDITSARAIMEAIDETEEWLEEYGQSLFRLVFEFDLQLKKKKPRPPRKHEDNPVEHGVVAFAIEGYGTFNAEAGPSNSECVNAEAGLSTASTSMCIEFAVQGYQAIDAEAGPSTVNNEPGPSTRRRKQQKTSRPVNADAGPSTRSSKRLKK